MRQEFTEQDFKKLVTAYGADPLNWPDNIRAVAQNFAQSNPETAGTLLSSEAHLDAYLDRLQTPRDSDLLKARILANAKSSPRDRGRDQPQNDNRRVGLRAAMALVIGAFTAGFFGGQFTAIDSAGGDPATLSAENSEQAEVWQDAALSYGMLDVYDWVEGTETSPLTLSE